MSPMISSSENSTAAIGVLNAAASAADAPTGTSALTLRRAQAEAAAEHGGDAGADVHRWPFAAERDAAGQRRRAADELAEHGAQARCRPSRDEQRGLGLRDAAAARVREIAEQQEAGDERRRAVGTSSAAPARSARRIHARGEPAGQQDEGDDHQPDERADDEAQDERELCSLLRRRSSPAPTRSCRRDMRAHGRVRRERGGFALVDGMRCDISATRRRPAASVSPRAAPASVSRTRPRPCRTAPNRFASLRMSGGPRDDAVAPIGRSSQQPLPLHPLEDAGHRARVDVQSRASAPAPPRDRGR